MKITRKRELTMTSERSVTIKFGSSQSAEKFCAACGEAAQFLTIDEAAIIWQTTARAVYRLIEAERVHYDETENGSLLVCFASLSKLGGEKILLPLRNQK